MSQIMITPEELESGAAAIEQYRENISSEVTALNNKISEVTANWKGAAQSAFLASYHDLYSPTLKDTFPEILTGISEQLKAAAKIMRETDEQLRQAMGA